MKKRALLFCLILLIDVSARGAVGIAPEAQRILKEPDSWFKSDEGRKIADNIVSWQNANGGWWKNYDVHEPRPANSGAGRTDDGPPGDTEDIWRKVCTFDNGATYSEMNILARAFRITQNEAYKSSFNKGLKYIFAAQYPNGGWPQRFPLQDNYGRRITYNDQAMIGVMDLLKDIVEGKPEVTFVSDEDRQRAAAAFEKGVECILNSQIKRDGKLTAWCEQVDEVTLAPAKARSYELPSISGDESAGITVLLMRIEKPDARVRDAIEAAVAWYDVSKIPGKRYEKVIDANGKVVDRVLKDDPTSVVWARFYEIDTNKPFFCSRDGIKHDSLSDVTQERRAGYAWYGNWGEKLPQAYAKWKQRVGN
jgi:pectinesterase